MISVIGQDADPGTDGGFGGGLPGGGAGSSPSEPKGCGDPSFAGDGYCDDNNNVEECGFDGGDCCRNTLNGWNFFCNVSFPLKTNDSYSITENSARTFK